MNGLEPLNGLVGYEADRIHNLYSGRVLDIVAVSPFRTKAGTIIGDSNMTFYTRTANNARVFSTGTIAWAHGLDNYNADASVGPVFRVPNMKADARRLTANILTCFINGTCG